MKYILFLFLLLSFSTAVLSQELPSNFEYKRETGQESGIPYFHVVPSTISIAYDGEQGNTFEAVGAIAQPERDKYGLVFMNAKKTFQFSTNKDKSCTLTIDGEETKYPKFVQGVKEVLGRLKIETVHINITKTVFDKLLAADDVTIRCGIVRYNLDQDNIDALQYLGSEIEKDLTRRKKIEAEEKP